MRRERGWNFTVHGVRSWPVRTALRRGGAGKGMSGRRGGGSGSRGMRGKMEAAVHTGWPTMTSQTPVATRARAGFSM